LDDLLGVLVGNTVQAAADLGGMAADIGLFVALPILLTVAIVAGVIFALQFWAPTP